jgi:hypothetical protein
MKKLLVLLVFTFALTVQSQELTVETLIEKSKIDYNNSNEKYALLKLHAAQLKAPDNQEIKYLIALNTYYQVMERRQTSSYYDVACALLIVEAAQANEIEKPFKLRYMHVMLSYSLLRDNSKRSSLSKDQIAAIQSNLKKEIPLIIDEVSESNVTVLKKMLQDFENLDYTERW